MARRTLGSLCILLGGALLGIVLLVPLAQGETVSAAPIPCTPSGYVDRLGNQLCLPAEAQTVTNTTGGGQTAGQTVTNTTGGGQTVGQTVTNTTGGGGQTAGQTVTNTTGGGQTAGQTVTNTTGGGAPSAGQVAAPILPKTGVVHRSGPESAQVLGIALALLLIASGFVVMRRGRLMRAQA